MMSLLEDDLVISDQLLRGNRQTRTILPAKSLALVLEGDEMKL